MSQPPNPFTVRLDEDTRKTLRHIARVEERSVGTVIRRALRVYIEQEYRSGIPTETA